jgi:hypothetical protein
VTAQADEGITPCSPASSDGDGDFLQRTALTRFEPFELELVRLLADAESTGLLVRAAACLFSLHCVAGAPDATVPARGGTQSATVMLQRAGLRYGDGRLSALWLVAVNSGAVGKIVSLAASLVDISEQRMQQEASPVVQELQTSVHAERFVAGDSRDAADSCIDTEAPDGDDNAACWSAICWVAALLARMRDVFVERPAADADDNGFVLSAHGARRAQKTCPLCKSPQPAPHMCSALWRRSADALVHKVCLWPLLV